MGIEVRTATVVEAGSGTAGTVSSITGTLPGDQQAGDFAVAALSVAAAANPTIPTPSGWTLLFTAINPATGEFFAAYSALAPGSGPTFTPSAAVNRATVEIQAFGGVDTTTTPWDAAIQTTSSAATTTLVATGVTTVTPGAMLVSAAMINTSSRDLNSPAGMTEDVTYAQAGGRALTFAHEALTGTGATGTRTWTWDATSLAAAAFVGALRPAPDAPHVLDATEAAVQESRRRRVAQPATTRVVRPTAAPSTTDVAITSTFGIAATATRTAFADAAVSAAFTLTADATVSSRLFTAETLEVEFAPAVWTDVTADWIAPLVIKQGRPTPFDEVLSGSLETRLHNIDGRYLTGLKGKRIRWKITKGEDTYTRFVGWIQVAKVSFPAGELRKGIVDIVAVDALGLLAQRKMRSNHTEHLLALARAAGNVAVEAYEAVGQTSGFVAELTNYSNDAAKSIGSYLYASTDATLSFGSDNDVSIGDVVTAPSAVSPSKVYANIRTGTLMLVFHIKTFSSVPTAENGFATMFAGATAYNLMCLTSGVLALRNQLLTTTLGSFGTMPIGQWCRIRGKVNTGNNALSDWQLSTQDGLFVTVTGVAIDVRAIDAVYYPAMIGSGTYPGSSFGGVGAIANNGTIGTPNSFPGSIQGTVADRVTDVADALTPLPISFTTAGTLTTQVATGRWDGRSAAAVLREVLRTTNGIAWARSRDSEVLALGADELYPATAVVAVDVDEDCVGPPTLVDASETTPTRIDVEYPGGIATANNREAETNGEIRPATRTSTVATTRAQALAVAEVLLARASTGLRISQITLDMNGAVHDPTAALFDETSTKGGLYPTQRIRVQVPPWYFGVSHYDVHVEGWTEVYGANNEVRLQLDTSPAIDQPLPVAQQFGAVRGQPTAVTASRARRAVNTGRALITRNRS